LSGKKSAATETPGETDEEMTWNEVEWIALMLDGDLLTMIHDESEKTKERGNKSECVSMQHEECVHAKDGAKEKRGIEQSYDCRW
jgi:hypothetical protein